MEHISLASLYVNNVTLSKVNEGARGDMRVLFGG